MAALAINKPAAENPRAGLSPEAVPMAPQPTILIVDDDFAIRQFLRILLTRLTSARVLDAADPFTAMRIALTVDRPVDLLISDFDLGCSIDGAQLAGRVASLSPSVKVVLMSADHTRESLIRPGWKFVQKPFGLNALLDALAPAVTFERPSHGPTPT